MMPLQKIDLLSWHIKMAFYVLIICCFVRRWGGVAVLWLFNVAAATSWTVMALQNFGSWCCRFKICCNQRWTNYKIPNIPPLSYYTQKKNSLFKLSKGIFVATEQCQQITSNFPKEEAQYFILCQSVNHKLWIMFCYLKGQLAI